MHSRFLRAAALAAALSPGFATCATLTLEQALALAVQSSESARAARSGVLSASETARAAGEFPDPVLGMGLENLPVSGGDRFNANRDSMTVKRLDVSQEWISGDKRALRRAAADAMTSRATVLVRVGQADTRLQTALAFLDAHYASEALKLATLMEHHAHEELEAAKGRLATTTGNGQEVLALTAAHGVAEDESSEVQQQRDAALVALERWVRRPVDLLDAPRPLGVPDEQVFVTRHPAVLAGQEDVAVAQRDASVAAANRHPNWTWRAGFGQRTNYSNLFSMGVSIPLPVSPGMRQDRETASKLALADQADGRVAEATRAAVAEYRTLMSDARRLAERIERYQVAVVVPSAQRIAAALAGYRSNQTSLMTLFEARHNEVEAQRKLLALRRDLDRIQARLAFRPLAQGDAP